MAGGGIAVDVGPVGGAYVLEQEVPVGKLGDLPLKTRMPLLATMTTDD